MSLFKVETLGHFKRSALVLSLLMVNPCSATSLDSIRTLLKKRGIDSAQVSFSVHSLDGLSHRIELNPDTPRKPASLSKLITAAGLYWADQRSMSFQAQVFADSTQIKESEVQGHVHLVSSGDPSFVSEDLWFLANQIRARGLKKISGNLVVDDSVFDGERFSSTRGSARALRAYDAPTSGFVFNWNTLNVHVRPFGDLKSPVVTLDPPCASYALTNQLKFGKSKSIRIAKSEPKSVVVSGSIPKGGLAHVQYVPVADPRSWASCQIRNFFKEVGVALGGNVTWGPKPAGSSWILIAESREKTVDELIQMMQKHSNNLIAESLAKKLGDGSLDEGVKRLKQAIVKNVSFSKTEPDFEFVNPSGLTQQNLISVSQLNAILSAIARDPHHGVEFLSSLPIAGYDGTLKRRFQKNTMENRSVRAKTGLLKGVVGLAGYILEKNSGLNSPKVFSLLYNGPSGKEDEVRLVFDEIVSTYF